MRSFILLATSALWLSGCALTTVHPDEHAALPPAPAPAVYAPAGGDAQRLETGVVEAEWWKNFHSPALDALVARALAHNEDLAIADATLRQAQEGAKAVKGDTLPQIDAGYSAERAHLSNSIATPIADESLNPYSLHTAQLSVNYPLDIFGGNRNRIASARAQTEVSAHQRDAARQMVVANLVLATIARAAFESQLEAAQQSVGANQKLHDLLLRRQALGDVGAADVAAQQTALSNAQAAVPPLLRALRHQQALISSLIGVPPGDPLPPLPDLDDFHLPDRLVAALPSDVVAMRPDVRAAEAGMRGAAADVGVAIAARLPQIMLSASVGGAATDIVDMFASGNPFWSLLGGISQPLFHSGALKHRQKAAEAALTASQAQYRSTVLNAFVEVQDALTAVATDAQAFSAALSASEAASRNLGYITRQLQLGNVGTLSVLNASTANAQAAAQLVAARAARLSDSVALFQAQGSPVDPPG